MEKKGYSEILRPMALSRLNILVHPLFLADHAVVDNQYAKDIETMKYQASRRFVPFSTSEFLLVMPHQKERNKENPKWMDLFTHFKNATLFKDNIQLLPDILAAHGSFETIERKLKQHEKRIDEDTEIIIGGEYIDECVESLAKKILQVPNKNIWEVTIDTRVGVYSDNDNKNNLPSWSGTMVSIDQRNGHIRLAKINPS